MCVFCKTTTSNYFPLKFLAQFLATETMLTASVSRT